MDDERVELAPWTDDDLPLLQRQDAPGMTAYLGGPEGEQKVLLRHQRFLREQGSTMWPFTIRVGPQADAVGSVAYWQTVHAGEDAYEMGWAVIPEHQGHGYGSRGIRLALEHAARNGDRRLMWAFPRTDNLSSNALARAGGFENTGEQNSEYPKGVPIVVNAWVFDLDSLR